MLHTESKRYAESKRYIESKRHAESERYVESKRHPSPSDTPIVCGASERLFLINPTMDGDSASWHRPSWGEAHPETAWSETMSLASYHDGKTEVWKYSGMVSDQAVLHPSLPPHEGFGRFAPVSHRGVNEKQPLRGTILETRLIIDLCFYSFTIGFKDFL